MKPPGLFTWTLEENEELFVEISKPAGAVAVMIAVRPVALTMKDCEAEAVPEAAVKFPRLEGVAEIEPPPLAAAIPVPLAEMVELPGALVAVEFTVMVAVKFPVEAG